MARIWKRGYSWPTVYIFSHQIKDTKIPLAHIALKTYTYFAHPIECFAQKLGIYHVWFLFGVTPGVDSFLRAILEQSINNKMQSKI